LFALNTIWSISSGDISSTSWRRSFTARPLGVTTRPTHQDRDATRPERASDAFAPVVFGR
jgi:hypothetical protein